MENSNTAGGLVKRSVLGVMLWILALWANAVGAIPRDSDLNIPAEDRYDEIKIEVDAQPYNLHPAGWKVLPLTGTWKYKGIGEAKDPKPVELAEQAIGEIVRELTAEPGNTNQAAKYQWQESAKLTNGNYVFVTSFSVPSDVKMAKRSCLLRFGGIATDNAIYINGKKVFENLGGWAPFTVDISRHIDAGKENTVAVIVAATGRERNYIFGIYQESEMLFVPAAYARRVLLNCDTSSNLLTLDCLITSNNKDKQEMPIVARINPYGSDKVLWESKTVQAIQPGDNSVRIEMRLENVVYWEPNNPQLYEVRLYGSNGAELGKERFGFRDFKAEGDYLYLNGKRMYLPGLMWAGDISVVNSLHRNTSCLEGKNYLEVNKRYHKTTLKGLKDAGSIIIRPNSIGGYRSRVLFEACDELGVLVYDDWARDIKIERTMQVQENWLYHVYNHPSVVMFSVGGNEEYDTQQWVNDHLNAMYDRFKALDKQGRPICSSSGRISVIALYHPNVKDKTDVCDDHSYYGSPSGVGSWLYNYDYFKELKRKITNIYGGEPKPLVSFEVIGGACVWYDPGYLKQWNRIFAGEKTDKKAYVAAVTLANLWGWEEHPRAALHAEGFRARYTDEMRSKKFMAEMSKRQWEILRQQSDIVCGIGAHVQALFLEYAYHDSSSLMYWKEKYPDLKFRSLAMDINKKEWQKSPGYYQMKRCYTPEFICAAWFERNLIAGLGAIKADIFAINDTETGNSYTAKVLFKDGGNKILDARTLEFGELKAFGRKILPYAYQVPKKLGTGHYRLEAYLFKGEKQVNDNYYDVYVVNENDLRCEKTGKKVALYDMTGKLFNGFNLPDTAGILRKMGLKHDALNTFDNLDKYQVLIVGANSIDTNVVNNGEAIRQWVEKGGRLLCFEQNRTGYIPWLSEMKLISANAANFAELVEETHPAFQGLGPENFDTWSRDEKYYKSKYGTLFNNVINLNETVVAAAATGYAAYPDDIKAVLADVKVGEGVVVLNQFEVTGRYRQDAVATRLCHNLVNYILSDEKGFSAPVSGKKVVRVNPKDCVQIDLKPYFNSSFMDAERNDGKGGWDDGGSKNDLRNMAVSKQDLAGIVFDVVDPRSNNDRSCVILKHKPVPWLPPKVEGIKVNHKFHYLYFLHTASYCGGNQGIPHYKFVIHYADGTVEEQVIKQGVHIVDWWLAQDTLPESTLAWSGKNEMHSPLAVYWTEWKNAKPTVEIASIDFVGEENCVPVLIGITGYTRTREEGWRMEGQK